MERDAVPEAVLHLLRGNSPQPYATAAASRPLGFGRLRVRIQGLEKEGCGTVCGLRM